MLKFKTPIYLTQEELDFLDKLSLDSLASSGQRLTQDDIVAALIHVAKSLDLSCEDVDNKEQLVQKILSHSSDFKEKRKYPRFKSSIDIMMRKAESLGEHKEICTKDIGFGGFRIETDFSGDQFALNQVLEVFINDSQEGCPPIRALGVIRWLKAKEEGLGYFIGIKLTYIKACDVQQFMKYISSQDDKPAA